MSEHVEVSLKAGVLEIVWARPKKKNALTNEMYEAAIDALRLATADDAVHAVLFAGQGDVFSAGNDLADFAAANAEPGADVAAARFIRELIAFEKPIVAGVCGLGVGVGLTMLLHCDLVFVAHDTVLSAPFVDLALCPEAAASLLLSSRIGHARAFAIMALGERISGTEAAAWGLANSALETDDVLPAAREAAQRIASKPPNAVRETKRLMRDTGAYQARFDEEAAAFHALLKGPEARAAFAAFLGKSRG